MPEPSIGLMGFYGHGNVGDELMLQRLGQRIEEHCGQRPIVLAERWEEIDGYPSRPWPGLWTTAPRLQATRSLGLAQWWRRLRDAPGRFERAVDGLRCLIIGGGTQFGTERRVIASDLEGWANLARHARRLGVPVLLYGVGIGYLGGWYEQRMLRRLLDACSLVVVRDVRSRALCDSVGSSITVHLGADPLYALTPAQSEALEPSSETHRVAIAPRLGDLRTGDEQAGECLAAFIAGMAESLARAGWEPILLPFWPERDGPVCRDAAEVAETPLPIRDTPGSLQEVSELFGGLAAGVTMPLHATLMAAIHGVPMVSLSYHPKCRALGEELGLGPYQVDLEGEEWPRPEEVVRKIRQATEDAHLATRIAEALAERRERCLASEETLLSAVAALEE
jgi:polysaccharide pyruvyl transferase WcaK-like protein